MYSLKLVIADVSLDCCWIFIALLKKTFSRGFCFAIDCSTQDDCVYVLLVCKRSTNLWFQRDWKCVWSIGVNTMWNEKSFGNLFNFDSSCSSPLSINFLSICSSQNIWTPHSHQCYYYVNFDLLNSFLHWRTIYTIMMCEYE